MHKRIRRKSGRKHQLSRRVTIKSSAPRTLKRYWAMSERDREMYNRSVHAVTYMRSSQVSRRKAARQYEIPPQIMVRFAGTALRKLRNGRYVARPSDKLLRVLVLPTFEGLQEVATRDSREASTVSKYWNAVHRYLATGDISAIHQFDGKQITDATGAKILLLTNRQELDRQGNAGNFSFESTYQK